MLNKLKRVRSKYLRPQEPQVPQAVQQVLTDTAGSDSLSDQYRLSEDRKISAFLAKLDEFQESFIEDEKTRSTLEASRTLEFDSLLHELNEAFDILQKKRQEEFLKQEDHISDIHTKNEVTLRKSIFHDGQRHRDIAYKEIEALWTKEIEEDVKHRGKARADAREQWEKACAEIEQALEEQFQRLSRQGEERFIRGEERRDAAVIALLEKHSRRNEDGSSLASGQNKNGDAFFPALDQAQGRSHQPSPDDVTLSNEGSAPVIPGRSRNHHDGAEGSIPSSTQDMSYRPQNGYLAPSLGEDSSSSGSVPSLKQDKPWSPPLGHFISSTEGTTSSVLEQPDSFVLPPSRSALPSLDNDNNPFMRDFIEAQKRRQDAFEAEERAREKHFESFEDAPNVTESLRDQIFEEEERKRLNQAESQLRNHSDAFTHTESVRAQAECLREQRFLAEQTSLKRTFRTFEMRVSQKLRKEETMENEKVAVAKTAVRVLCLEQLGQLAGRRGERRERFRKEQERRVEELGLVMPLNESGEVTVQYSESRSISNYAKPRRCLKTLFSFSPKEVVSRRGVHLFDPLPLPSIPITVPQMGLGLRFGFQDDQNTREQVFERFLLSIDEVYHLAAHRRRQSFLLSESTRAEMFTSAQRKRKNRSFSFFKTQETRFQEAQVQRRRLFEEAEQKRDQAFLEAEKNRETMFYETILETEENWARALAKIREIWTEGARKRVTEMVTWGWNLVREREQTWGEEEDSCEQEQVKAWKAVVTTWYDCYPADMNRRISTNT